MLEIASKPSGNLTANSVSLTPIGGSAKRLVDIVLATFGIVIYFRFLVCAFWGHFCRRQDRSSFAIAGWDSGGVTSIV
jgi:hypothetical protein